jgi:hypothetical protein
MAEAIGLLAFQAIGLGAAAGFTIGATTITLGAVVGTAILVGGSIGLQMLTAPSFEADTGATRGTPTRAAGGLPAPESGHFALRQPIPPRTVAYGTVRLAGTYVLFEADDDGTSWDVIAFHHGRIGGIIGYYLHDDIITVDGIGGGTVIGLPDGRYGLGHISLDTRMGFPLETPYPQPIAAMPEIWTDQHRGDGLASLMLRCGPTVNPELFTAVYPRGKPEPSVVCAASLIYDPRDPSQIRLDPQSWKPSTNPVVQLLHYLTSEDHGMGLDWDTLIAPVLTTMINEINLADSIVIRSNGIGEYLYSSSGSFQIDSEPTDVINAILDTCDGWMSENGDGTLALKIGLYREPSVTLASKHIRGVNLQFDLADEEIVNELVIDYTEPGLDYKTVAVPTPWRNDEDIAERGKVRSQRFALPWVQSYTQARRLAKRRDAQNNAELRGTITTTLYGLAALGERWIRIQAPELPALEDIVVEIRGVTIDLLNASLTFKFISIDPETIDLWSPFEEGPKIKIPPKLVNKPPPIIEPDPVTGAIIDAYFIRFVGPPAAIYESYAFCSFPNPEQAGLQYQTQFRLNGVGDFVLEPPQQNVIGSPTRQGYIGIYCLFNRNGAFLGQNYEVQIRSVSSAGQVSDWSASMTVTTNVDTPGGGGGGSM